MPLRFALDQNFPTPIVDCLAQYIVGVDLSSLTRSTRAFAISMIDHF
jgi:hypothetical protein